jgi:hypothetical protein
MQVKDNVQGANDATGLWKQFGSKKLSSNNKLYKVSLYGLDKTLRSDSSAISGAFPAKIIVTRCSYNNEAGDPLSVDVFSVTRDEFDCFDFTLRRLNCTSVLLSFDLSGRINSTSFLIILLDFQMDSNRSLEHTSDEIVFLKILLTRLGKGTRVSPNSDTCQEPPSSNPFLSNSTSWFG